MLRGSRRWIGRALTAAAFGFLFVLPASNVEARLPPPTLDGNAPEASAPSPEGQPGPGPETPAPPAAPVEPTAPPPAEPPAPAPAAPPAPPAPAPEARYADRVGLAAHLIWTSEEEILRELERLRSSGLEWVREDFLWDTLEPSRGSFDWRRSDALMSAASRAQVNVLAIIGYSARWASSGPDGDTHYPPSDPADYARFALAVADRYAAGGAFWQAHPELAPRPLTHLEIWNEPWGYWFWKPEPDPAAYARLARTTATMVKQAHPELKLLLSGDLMQGRRDGASRPWLKELLAADPSLPRLFDAYAVHPYPWPRDRSPYDETLPGHDRYSRVATTHELDPSLPIWITEIGWSTATGAGDAVTESTQAAYVRGAISRAVGEWGSYVTRTFVYSLDRDSGPADDREGHYGLLRADGSPKPAWDSLVALTSRRG